MSESPPPLPASTPSFAPQDPLKALTSYLCPACGAAAVWTPSKHALVCPYCGVESPAEIKSDGSLVAETDLDTALQAIPQDERGWAVERKTVRCQSCNAISVFDEKRVGQRCDFCGSAAMMAVDDIKAPIRPCALLPFKIAESKVREDMRVWYGSHWFAPNALKTKALTDTLHGIYLPYWTFDAQTSAQWTAEAGYYYYTTNSKGERTQHTRWQSASGALQHFFDDVLIAASQGVHPKLLIDLEPFPTTKELMPYDPGYLSGWVVEQYQIDLTAAAKASKDRMDAELRKLCGGRVPGDTYRNLQVKADYSERTFKHVLLPVWLLTYTYGAKNFQVAVNGYTGKITGEYPLSWIKVTLVTILVIFIILIWIGLSSSGHH